jgi:transcriptional regulator with XRE-family HTH domain
MTPSAARPAVRERRRRVTRWTVNVDAFEHARILRGWTLVDLSRAAHVDRGTLSDLIHEVRQPTLGKVQAIVGTLGLTMADVIVFLDGRD